MIFLKAAARSYGIRINLRKLEFRGWMKELGEREGRKKRQRGAAGNRDDDS